MRLDPMILSPRLAPASPGPIVDTWQHRLQLARSASEVIKLARHFLATLGPSEVAMLPARCEPRKLVVPEDLSSYAFDLVAHYCDERAGARPVIGRLAMFFVSAALRLSQLAGCDCHAGAGAA